MVVYIRTNHKYYKTIFQKNRDNSILLSYNIDSLKNFKIMLDFYYLIYILMEQNLKPTLIK